MSQSGLFDGGGADWRSLSAVRLAAAKRRTVPPTEGLSPLCAGTAATRKLSSVTAARLLTGGENRPTLDSTGDNMSRRSPIILLTILAVGMGLAQRWEFEQVDTAPWGARVQMRWHPDGRLFLCYGAANGGIRLAWKDSAWHHEDVALPPYYRGLSFDVGPQGQLGVVCEDTSWMLVFGLKQDTAWEFHQVPLSAWPTGRLAFSTCGTPVVLCTDGVRRWLNVLDCRLMDTVWSVDTVATHDPAPGSCSGSAGQLLSRIDGSFVGSYWFAWDLAGLGGRPISSIEWYMVEWSGDSWARTHLVGVAGGNLSGGALALYPDGSVGYCYSVWEGFPPSDGFYFDGARIDTVIVVLACLAIDSSSRPLIASIQHWSANELWFRHRDSSWHLIPVGPSGVQDIDLAIDSSGEPLIAYARDGVWLAKGVDITGLAGQEPGRQAARNGMPSTISSRVLQLSQGQRSNLVDIAGRKVMDLRTGENDIRHVAPGVYFVHRPTAGSRQLTAVRKIVIQR
jgi:hypothetical protein